MKRLRLGVFVLLFCGPAIADGLHQVDQTTIDSTVKPGDNLFLYANGAWLKTAEIPPESGSWGRIATMRDQTLARTDALIQDVINNPTRWHDAATRKVIDFCTSFMDEAGIDRRGLSPLETQLKKIDAINGPHSLATALGRQLRADVDTLNNTNFYTENLFGLWVAPDLDDPKHYVPYLLQGGLGMPSRDYYLSDSADSAAVRAAYLVHVTNVLIIAGIPDAAAKAARIIALETAIAAVQTSRTSNADVHLGYNPWSAADFDKKAPGLDWESFFSGADMAKTKRFIVWQPAAIAGMARIVGDTPVSIWREYLSYHLINHFSPYLPKPLAQEHFDFYGRVLTGSTVQRARWKRSVDAANAVLGDAIGHLYASKEFPAASRARISEMVQNILRVYAKRIDAVDWMSPATKGRAKEKLASLYIGIGHPEHWRSYNGLTINRRDLAGNMMRSELFEYRRAVDRIAQPVDESEWAMTPQTVNAVNLPLQNALNFPAAYLQPPMFDPEADDAYNYGGIGATIGHEISHAFDDQGSQFDAQGRLADWWTPEDLARFRAVSAHLATQYDGYCPFADACVNGQQTLSENIADVSGVQAAFDAWRAAGAHAENRGPLTGEQEFFLSYAQRWQVKTRDSALRGQLLTDGHAPAQYRALTVRNIDAWYSAFHVGKGDALYLAPADRVKVW